MINQLVTNCLNIVFNEQGLTNYEQGETIYGLNGKLNSLALVRLIVELETQIQEEFGHSIILTDNKVLSAKNSPFKDFDNLVAFVEQKIAEIG
ncbi:MAG: hypothetical protein JXQ87_04490 [Bacteroidia bacterium]